MYVFFFFQAEDGIRDYKVTGVQTCALPIYGHAAPAQPCAQEGVLRAEVGKPPGVRGENAEIFSLRQLRTVGEDELSMLRKDTRRNRSFERRQRMRRGHHESPSQIEQMLASKLCGRGRDRKSVV